MIVMPKRNLGMDLHDYEDDRMTQTTHSHSYLDGEVKYI